MKSSNDKSRARPKLRIALALGLAAALSGCGIFNGDEFAEDIPYAGDHYYDEDRADEARFEAEERAREEQARAEKERAREERRRAERARDEARDRDSDDDGELAVAPVTTGPAADYPVVIGEPYRVGSQVYTPSDALNYDEVGYSQVDRSGGAGVSASHHTLPLPSYIEVTSLATGRTILVRVERRGPMGDNSVVGLSPGAAEQLGAGSGAAVRVRRVNPPEAERAALRLGGRATERLQTPETLLTVLRRKLPGGEGAALADASQYSGQSDELPPAYSPQPVAVPPSTAARPSSSGVTASLALPPLPPLSGSSSASPDWQAPAYTPPPVAYSQPPQARPAPSVARAPAPAYGGFVVQAGAFSTADRAQRVANVIGGNVTRAGGVFRVRTGPFTSRAQAEASLAKVRAAGYSEARIFTNG